MLEAQQLEPVTQPGQTERLVVLGQPRTAERAPDQMAGTPEAGRVDAGDDESALRSEHPVDLAQNLVRMIGELEDVRQDDQIERLGLERKRFVVVEPEIEGADRDIVGLQREKAMLDAVLAQGVEFGQTALQGVVAEDVGHDRVILALLPLERIAAGRRLEPGSPRAAVIAALMTCRLRSAPYNRRQIIHIHRMQTPDPWRHAAVPHPLVTPIDAFSDNYLWLLRAPDGDGAVVVDPGDAAPIQAALAASGLRLVAILLTHHHADHVGGVAELVEQWSCPVYGPAGEDIPTIDRPLMGSDIFRIDALGAQFEVIDVPGHTLGHIAYRCDRLGDDPRPLLFCGDTLFAAGCGRIFEGTPEQMLASLDRLAALAPDTLVYCAHEYTISNLRFAATADPESPLVAERLIEATRMRELGQRTVPTSIGIERETNPFLRSDAPAHARSLAVRLGREPASRVEAFAALREWKNVHRA